MSASADFCCWFDTHLAKSDWETTRTIIRMLAWDSPQNCVH